MKEDRGRRGKKISRKIDHKGKEKPKDKIRTSFFKVDRKYYNSSEKQDEN